MLPSWTTCPRLSAGAKRGQGRGDFGGSDAMLQRNGGRGEHVVDVVLAQQRTVYG